MLERKGRQVSDTMVLIMVNDQGSVAVVPVVLCYKARVLEC